MVAKQIPEAMGICWLAIRRNNSEKIAKFFCGRSLGRFLQCVLEMLDVAKKLPFFTSFAVCLAEGAVEEFQIFQVGGS